MKTYETTFIVDAQLEDSAIGECIERATDFLSARAQEVIQIDRWGERRLAYEIKKRQQGYYVLMQYQAEGTVVAELEQMFRLDEGILRYLTVISEVPAAKENVEATLEEDALEDDELELEEEEENL